MHCPWTSLTDGGLTEVCVWFQVGNRVGVKRCSDDTMHILIDGEDMGPAATAVAKVPPAASALIALPTPLHLYCTSRSPRTCPRTLVHTHTHACTHTRVLTHSKTHMHKYVWSYTHACTWPHLHLYTNACTHTHMYTRTQTLTYTNAHVLTGVCKQPLRGISLLCRTCLRCWTCMAV